MSYSHNTLLNNNSPSRKVHFTTGCRFLFIKDSVEADNLYVISKGFVGTDVTVAKTADTVCEFAGSDKLGFTADTEFQNNFGKTGGKILDDSQTAALTGGDDSLAVEFALVVFDSYARVVVEFCGVTLCDHFVCDAAV